MITATNLAVWIALACVSISSIAHADLPRPDGHAPISIMGDHAHKQGEWMLGYRYMSMDMANPALRTTTLSNKEIHDAGFNTAPKSMKMDMHMVEVMKGLTDRLTAMLMVPYSVKSMDMTVVSTHSDHSHHAHHFTPNGNTFSHATSGVGDPSVSILASPLTSDTHTLILNMGMSLPLGSIDEKDGMPNRLPYMMQLGSGTVDLLWGATHTAKYDGWSWGNQLAQTNRVGKNKHGYALGDITIASVWVAKPVSKCLSSSLKLSYTKIGDVTGEDSQIASQLEEMSDANPRQGREQVDLGLGINFLAKNGHRLAIEYLHPLYQSSNAIQLQTQSTWVASWQKAF